MPDIEIQEVASMNCGKCNTMNDGDAAFCVNCGGVLTAAPRKGLWSYRYALLLLPVMLVAMGAGYYKFILPNGVAAVVNGEEITLAELDSRVRPNGKGADVSAETLGQMRYAALSELITERIVLQEASKAGVRVSDDEVQAAIRDMRAASGLDDKGFAARINELYGSMSAFRKGLERRLAIRKFIDGSVTAGASSPADANLRLNQWMKDSTAKAAVRVSLAEQSPASGCGCCGGGGAAAVKQGCDPAKGAKQGCDPKVGAAAGANQVSNQGKAAQEAALVYWHQQNGSGPVETKVTDFGCHVQVDIVSNNRIAKSLRYQNGTITEM
jgi:hypothetical protein